MTTPEMKTIAKIREMVKEREGETDPRYAQFRDEIQSVLDFGDEGLLTTYTPDQIVQFLQKCYCLERDDFAEYLEVVNNGKRPDDSYIDEKYPTLQKDPGMFLCHIDAERRPKFIEWLLDRDPARASRAETCDNCGAWIHKNRAGGWIHDKPRVAACSSSDVFSPEPGAVAVRLGLEGTG